PLAAHTDAPSRSPPPVDEPRGDPRARYVDAFARRDIAGLVSLLHEHATLQMPPYPLWMRGAGEYRNWLLGPGSGCRGSRLAPIKANGAPAFAQWRADPEGGFSAWSIHVLTLSAGAITAMDFFVDPDLFALCDLPVRL